MKKRLLKKLNKKQQRIDNACSECGKQLIVAEFAKHHDNYLGDFIVPGVHRECPHCGSAEFASGMFDLLQCMKAERIKELLQKNYPIETNEYISADEMCRLEQCRMEELLKDDSYFNQWVYHLDLNGTRYYLKKSYQIYKLTNRPGWFDITYHHKQQAREYMQN